MWSGLCVACVEWSVCSTCGSCLACGVACVFHVWDYACSLRTGMCTRVKRCVSTALVEQSVCSMYERVCV